MKFKALLHFLFILHDECSRRKIELSVLYSVRESSVLCENIVNLNRSLIDCLRQLGVLTEL